MGMPDHVTFKKALAQYDALNTEGDVSRLRDIVSILKEISEFGRWWNRDLPRKENPDMYLKMCLSEADALAIVSGSVSAWEEEDDAYLTRVRENLRNYSRHGRRPVELLRTRELLELLDIRHTMKSRRVSRLNVAYYELVIRCIRYVLSEVHPGPIAIN
jgi:hypothetical protein